MQRDPWSADGARRWLKKMALEHLDAGTLFALGMKRVTGRGRGPASNSDVPRVYPEEFTRDIPDRLAPAAAPASGEEVERADAIRRPFILEGQPAPYMADAVRVMRLLEGRRVYLEVGTYDRGMLAYASSCLAADGILVDLDVEARPEATKHLEQVLQPGQRLVTVTGDAVQDATVAQVREQLGGEPVDLVMIDADHRAEAVMALYAAVSPLVRDDGLVLIRGVYWSGNDHAYGPSAVVEQLDRIEPVYVVLADHPLHRFLPWMQKHEVVWGGFAVVQRR